MAMSSPTSRDGRVSLSEINVTPMVDVMLVLLIIFMVAAPMLTGSVEVDLPETEAPQVEVEQEKLLLSVTAEKKVFLGRDEIPFEKLESTLKANRRIQTESELYVQADEEVPYGFAVRVFGIVRKAGIKQLGLVTRPLPEGSEGSQ